LALAEDIEDYRSTRELRRLPVRKAAIASLAMGIDNSRPSKRSKKIVQEDSDSETESSEVSYANIV